MKKVVVYFVSLLLVQVSFSQVTLETEKLITNNGLYFDGRKVPRSEWPTYSSNSDKIDFAFGPGLSAHGDCVDRFGKYVFVTWYKGGKANKNLMLSRYNTETGSVKTIEFDHKHKGLTDNPDIGESHNTAAVGICPIDGTIHMIYDIHSQSKNSPGIWGQTYFNYQVSKKNVLDLPDAQFNKSRFNAPQQYLNSNYDDYETLTYPAFFRNGQGELFTWLRKGGAQDGKYRFAKYNGTVWGAFKDLNYENAGQLAGVPHDFGIYGDIKFANGKVSIGFATRKKVSNDRFSYNNGFHYAYSNDPNGLNNWFNASNQSITIPFRSYSSMLFYEPGDFFPTANGVDEIEITGSPSWDVTSNGDIHFTTRIVAYPPSGRTVEQLHTYRKAGTSQFITKSGHSGGKIFAVGDEVFSIGLRSGRPYIDKAPGGTDNWTRQYTSPNNSRKYRHGVTHVEDGKAYYFLQEEGTGSGQPLHVLVFDLGVEQSNNNPIGQFIEPSFTTIEEGYDDLYVKVEASDPDGDDISLMLSIDGTEIRPENGAPYEWGQVSSNPVTDLETQGLTPGDHLFEVRITDGKGGVKTISKTITVTEKRAPFSGSPINIPGILEAEHYDKGGQGIAYNDADVENRGGALRTDYVDIVDNGPGNYSVGWTSTGEWLEYTVNVSETDSYDLIVTYSSGATTQGLLGLDLDGTELISGVPLQNSGDWNTYTDLKIDNMELLAGEHVLRIKIEKNGFNIDKIEFEKSIITSLNEEISFRLNPYPNPSKSGVFALDNSYSWEVLDARGNSLLKGEGEEINLNKYSKGIYFLKVENSTKKLIYSD